MSRWKGPLTVLLVTCLVLFITFTSQTYIIWPSNLRSIYTLIPLNFFVVMVLVNYALTCKTNPGTVPDRWRPRQEAYIEVKKSTHTPRFCRTCDNYKPPRTHHCSCCDRCVLKMDHHCPWVNNCVGFKNYCHFIRFLVYIDISAIYLLALLSCRVAQIVINMHHDGTRPTALEITFLSLNMILLSVVLVAVGILTAYHVYCITTNTTTIEGWEKGRSLTIKGMDKIQNVKCPYDQGIYRNIQSVLGRYPLFWLIPQPMKGSGLDFPISIKYLDGDDEESIASTTTEEPQPLKVEIAKLQPLKAKPSIRSLPNTPASIITFASTTTTLVDQYQYYPPFRKEESDYSISSK